MSFMKSKKKLRVICTILFCFALIGLLSWLIWSELHHSRPIIRNINAVTRISGTYVYAEDETRAPSPNALVPSVRINDAMFSPVWNVPVSIDNILIDDLVDGWITSVVRISEWPMENDQGNLTLFLDAPYMFYNDGVILFIDGEWNFFEYRDDFDFLE